MKYPFDREKDLRVIGTYPAVPKPYGMPGRPYEKFDAPITPRENLLRLYRGETPLWMPDMGHDCNFIQPNVMPDAVARNRGGVDWFGIQWKMEPTVGAAMVAPHTRRLSDITKWREEIVWPDLGAIDWAKDYAENYAPVVSAERATVFVIVNGLFERLADLTSFEDLFCYLIEEPEELAAFYDRLTDWHIELFGIAKKYYHADVITFHDDMGSQKNSFMSPAMFSEIMLPQYRKLNDAAHAMGLYMNFHSCGKVENLLPGFIAAGFDSWEAQAGANDIPAVLDKYNDKLVFTGFHRMPDTYTDAEATAFIHKLVDGFGKNRRYFTYLIDGKTARTDASLRELYAYSREKYSK